MSWSNLHASLFSDFIAILEKTNIRYFILRNYEGLPLNNVSKDVDIIVEPGTYKVAVKHLNALFLKYGFFHPYIADFNRLHCVYGANTVAHHSIHIDLIEGFLHNGFELFTFDELYNHTKVFNGFRVLDDDYDTVLLIYYKLFMAKHLIPRYRNKIISGFNKVPSEIHRILVSSAGKKLGNQIFNYLSENRFEDLEKNTKTISHTTKSRSFFRHPIRTTYNIISFLANKFYWVVLCPKRRQKFFAVLGPDGVGKSTFIDLLEKEINYYAVEDGNKCVVYHHRPSIMPNLGALGERAHLMKENKDFTNPHRGKPAGFISSLFRMFYYFSDYFLFMYFIVRRNAKFDLYTIFDRYIYDFLIDPLRSNINLPYCIRSFFAFLIIEPRVVFILYADAETIYQRKQELSTDEIQRQLAEYRKLASTSSRFVLLDASQTPEQLVAQATECLWNRFSTYI